MAKILKPFNEFVAKLKFLQAQRNQEKNRFLRNEDSAKHLKQN